MARPTLDEQISQIDSAVKDYPQYLDLLDLQRSILEILKPLADSPKKGAREVLSDEDVKKLLERAVNSKKPVSSFLNASFFDVDVIQSVALDVVQRLLQSPRARGEELEGFLEPLKMGEIEVRSAINAILEEDAEWFHNLSSVFGVEPSLLLFVFETPLRPFFEEIARRVEPEIIETWWTPFCPVCGRTSPMAKVKHRKRYMACTYCGAEYLVDLFLCVNCGNKEPNSLGFITFKEYPEFELNYCEKCKRYIKSIYEDRLKRRIPNGLEDHLTRDLDTLAKKSGLCLVRT